MIKNIIMYCCGVLTFITCSYAQQKQHLTQYVKPNIGSVHSRYFFYTPAAVPFGMAKLAPSTDGSYGNRSGWEAVGYDDRHHSIAGFPHFHEFQIGGVVFAPTVGEIKTNAGKVDMPYSGYLSSFDKVDEFATSGYYRVKLKDYGVQAELTATKRVGFHKYTFPSTDSANVIFDIGHVMGESGPVIDAEVTYDQKHVWGYVITSPLYVQKYQKGADIKMYFFAEIDKLPVAYGTFLDSEIFADKKTIKGKGAGLYLRFKTKKGEAIELKTGLSYTSIENAKLNLLQEAKKLNFEEAKKNAIQIWDAELGRVLVEGGKIEDRTKFYTALYHALLGRGLASDVNGAYPKNDGSIGQIPLNGKGIPVHHHYNTDAIWGAFWNLTQLWSIAYPDYYNDWIQSQLLVYKDAGWLGDGIANSKYVSGVGTNFTGLAIAAAYNVGIRNYDVDLAYQAVRKNELESKDRLPGAGKLDVGVFVDKGYSPYIKDETGNPELLTNGSPFGASHTLEYAFSAAAAAQFAKSLKHESDYSVLNKLSDAWRTLYDPSTKFMRPKDSEGKFIQNFNPYESWRGFQEGNAWQYTFYVPHVPQELVKLVGEDLFNRRLDSIFTISQKNIFGGGAHIDAFAGIESLYNHGNQPNLHISWLFYFSGRPDLSQKWVRAICNEFYGTEAIHGYGFGQDEDQGQLGAWYVMSSIGLFDVRSLTGENPSFQVGAPLFDRITISLPKTLRKNKFEIEVKNQDTSRIYLDQIQLNGKILSGQELPFQDLVKGGKMSIVLKNK
ncbi:GH92 family glycosyl hydrolase [Sphingobacterium sp. UDSM-2020]|uniref:GH92 family glycosyl hydrolase n=1 Tax=Sphingobacterium sp. UDSM-2020 TaxID=2795738 RepID=UPI001934C6D3|nr:GH92 family glycosyl hydrolase [Sphingobacterium sp. UDSM-2020]QQD16167.1 GH92 family glycosyl hydrolase [Sphingobacterium sp. UDSM-2020]